MKHSKEKQQNLEKFDFGTKYVNQTLANILHHAFARHGYVKLPGLISQSTFDALKTEVQNLVKYSVNKNFTMPGYETPRVMTTIGGQQILRHSSMLRCFYEDTELRSILSGIVGSQLFDNCDDNEWCVSTWLNGTGQTHGFHLDDPPIALIIILETPPHENGGYLEVVPDWQEISFLNGQAADENVTPLVNELRQFGLVHVKPHNTGDAYLLRADQNLHAVAPLRGKSDRRSILNLAFELEPNIVRRSETAAALFES